MRPTSITLSQCETQRRVVGEIRELDGVRRNLRHSIAGGDAIALFHEKNVAESGDDGGSNRTLVAVILCEPLELQRRDERRERLFLNSRRRRSGYNGRGRRTSRGIAEQI